MPGITCPEVPLRRGRRSYRLLARARATDQQKMKAFEDDLKDVNRDDCGLFIDWDIFDFHDTVKGGESERKLDSELIFCRCEPFIVSGELCVEQHCISANSEILRSRNGDQEDAESDVKSHHVFTVLPYGEDEEGFLRWCPVAYEKYLIKGYMEPCKILIERPRWSWVYHHPQGKSKPPRLAEKALPNKICPACEVRNDPEGSLYRLGTLNYYYPKDTKTLQGWENIYKPDKKTIYKPIYYTDTGILEEPAIVDGEAKPWETKSLEERPTNIIAAIEYGRHRIVDGNWGLVESNEQYAESAWVEWLKKSGADDYLIENAAERLEVSPED